MFQDINQFLPLNKELKRKDYLENKYITNEIFCPEYNPFHPCFCGSKNYYNIIFGYSLMDKLEDEIRYKWEERYEDAMKELLRYKDKNKEMRNVIWSLEDSFRIDMYSFFLKLLSKSIKMANLEMMKFLIGEYMEYVSLVKKISVKKIDEEVVKYMKSKGLDIKIKNKLSPHIYSNE